METSKGILAENIKRLRKAAHLTQAQLAEAANISLRNFQDIEYGRVQSPRMDTLRAIAKGLNVEFSELFEFGHKLRPLDHATEDALEIKKFKERLAEETADAFQKFLESLPSRAGIWPAPKELSVNIPPGVDRASYEAGRQELIALIDKLSIDSFPGAKRALRLVLEAEAMAEAEIAAAQGKQVAPKFARAARK